MRKRIRSPVCNSEKHTSGVATVTPEASGVPHAMVGTACFALSPVDGLFRHRSGNYDLPPSSRTKRRLDVSVRRQHRGARTTRLQPSASCAVVIRRTFHVPDLTPHAATASRPAYRDDRETPLITGRGEKEYSPKSKEYQAVNARKERCPLANRSIPSKPDSLRDAKGAVARSKEHQCQQIRRIMRCASLCYFDEKKLVGQKIENIGG